MIKGTEDTKDMEIENVYQIAKREWDNIRISLCGCGNVPNLDYDHFVTTKPGLITSLMKGRNYLALH